MAFINNDAKYPITNISANFTEVIEDFDTLIDGKMMHPIEYSKFFPFYIGDVMSGNQKLFCQRDYDKTYKSILIVYNIGWRNGHYTGAFRIKNKEKAINSIIEDAKLTMYSKGLNLHGVVKINDMLSPVMPFKQP
jgi:hypothetical protein